MWYIPALFWQKMFSDVRRQGHVVDVLSAESEGREQEEQAVAWGWHLQVNVPTQQQHGRLLVPPVTTTQHRWSCA